MVAARGREYHERNREMVLEKKKARYRSHDPAERRAAALQRLYGLKAEDYDRIYKQQNGCCAICRTPQELLVVDHCHSTAAIRGLLCNSCNLAIGMFQESVEIVTAAAEYLQANNDHRDDLLVLGKGKR